MNSSPQWCWKYFSLAFAYHQGNILWFQRKVGNDWFWWKLYLMAMFWICDISLLRWPWLQIMFNPLSNGANCFSIYFPNFNIYFEFFSLVNVHISLWMVVHFVSNLFYYLWASSSLVCKFIGQLWNNIY